mmetsp:Transcript_87137/g.154240  ORF Transcript_87137/g.154240 Transcript_87137/m.154240 type:complete len:1080 (-) Transcript_87137:69-3308(-)|eukprot:CAMPEP_0197633388 /NCGR_PEP_ID=MMETSP1338-20131121/9766_1 /TAXON_ID=43686 ORGANISM="Pelagodinium beii, Strain RCC1491" /NCGR_SAMPLE_ID=MMETSP1338 /ASSEMBLY_ACC=CAM_ASM_000754 /LENGTH=1079 /DNA_ID=CAMNT_0043205045 /DNA_START=121 /DNA_END=3360 /DNA_ORIENTATION=-
MIQNAALTCLLLVSFTTAVSDSDSDEAGMQVQEAEIQVFGDASAPARLLRSEIQRQARVKDLQKSAVAANGDSHPLNNTLPFEPVKAAQTICKLGDWNEWGSCSHTCGGGTRPRSRHVISGPQVCASSEIEACATAPCQPTITEGHPRRTAVPTSTHANCKWTEWSSWSVCSVTCGVGLMDRKRNIIPESSGGKSCELSSQDERKSCVLHNCPVDCDWSDWSDWEKCSTTCGAGHSSRARLVRRQAENGGKECFMKDSSQGRSCDDSFCPDHCQYASWSEWEACSASCGPGSTRRVREIAVPAANGGRACHEPTLEDKNCELRNCPVDCRWADWNPWSECTSSCGAGNRARNRSEVSAAKFGGEQCHGQAEQSVECSGLPACPTDCSWEDWQDWGSCSTTCGAGILQRKRDRKKLQSFGGKFCAGTDFDEKSCHNSSPCKVDCKTGDWSAWTSCSVSCGSGTRARSRTIVQDKLFGGQDCPHDLSEKKDCSLGACAVDCVWSLWSDWSPCTKSCGGGFTSRKRQELIPASTGGLFCNGAAYEETVCEAKPCAVDCAWSTWTEWTECSHSCNPGRLGTASIGVQSKSRKITIQPENGGASCEGPASQSQSCNEQACPVDCSWQSWSDWTVCPETCGGGTITRDRKKAHDESDGGLPCIGETHESQTCNTAACPVDCQWGPWSVWSICSKTCGGGVIRRYRDVAVTDKHGGNVCLGPPEQEAECGGNSCGVDCEWNDWNEWSACTVSCGGGRTGRERSIKTLQEHGGMACTGNHTEEFACNSDHCPVDCIFKDWSAWTDCSVSCGKGSYHRQRVKKLELYGGKPCVEALIDVAECSQDPGVYGCPLPTTSTVTAAHIVGHVGATPAEATQGRPVSVSPAAGHVYNKSFKAVHQHLSEPEATSTTTVEPCTKDKLAATIVGSLDGKNMSAIIERLLKLKGMTKKHSEEPGRKIATVTGDLKFYTENPDGFIATDEAKMAALQTLQTLAGVSKKYINVDVTIAMLERDASADTMKGNINVHYAISVFENDNAGDPHAVTSHILPSTSDQVTHEMLRNLKAAGSKEVVQAISMSMKVEPVLPQH